MSTTNSITVRNTFNGNLSGTTTTHRSLRAAVREALRRVDGIGGGWGVRIYAPAAVLDGGLLPRAMRDELGAAKWETACTMLAMP